MEETISLEFLFNGKEALSISGIEAEIVDINEIVAYLDCNIKFFVPKETRVEVIFRTRLYDHLFFNEYFEDGGEVSFDKQEMSSKVIAKETINLWRR